MIFWEKQSWKTGRSSTRLTLWADGRPEITLEQLGKPKKTKPGWSAREENGWTIYKKTSPFSPEQVRQKYRDAFASGIDEMRTFTPGYVDGSGTPAGVRLDGKLTQTVIPMFVHDGKTDNKGSENHKKFLAIEAILGNFDADPAGH